MAVQGGLRRYLGVVVAAVIAWSIPAAPARAAVDYAKQIKPLIAERCVRCHGPLKQEAGLRLDTAAAMRRTCPSLRKDCPCLPPG